MNVMVHVEYKILVENHKEKRSFGRHRCWWKDKVKMNLRDVAQDRGRWRPPVNRVPNFLIRWACYLFFKETLFCSMESVNYIVTSCSWRFLHTKFSLIIVPPWFSFLEIMYWHFFQFWRNYRFIVRHYRYNSECQSGIFSDWLRYFVGSSRMFFASTVRENRMYCTTSQRHSRWSR